MSRTAFFRLGDEPNAARTLLLLTSCGMTTTAPSRATDLPWSELAAGVRGAVTLPSDPGYDEARAVYNGAVDRRPAALVRCADVADVITCVNFAREHDMALAIRGGGHHGGGFGVWDDALVIDLGGLRSTTVNPAAHTVRVDGGCTWGDVDHATGAFGMATPSGFISTTGVGGQTLGGGVGYLSRRFGLSIDNLLSADVVLADGSFVTASHDSHQDLFWALRGGGGNFGVVTSFTFACHEIGDNGTVIAGPVFYDLADTEAVFRWYRELLPALPEELSGWIGVMVIAPGSPLPEELWGRKVCGIVWCYTGPHDKADDVLAAVREFGSPLLVGTAADAVLGPAERIRRVGPEGPAVVLEGGLLHRDHRRGDRQCTSGTARSSPRQTPPCTCTRSAAPWPGLPRMRPHSPTVTEAGPV